MREVKVKDVDGREWLRLVPESDEERRELTRRSNLASGGVDARDELEDDDDFADE